MRILFLGLMLMTACVPEAHSEIQSTSSVVDRGPETLRECYLQVAMKKSTADMAYIAKQLCESAFVATPRSLVVLPAGSERCEEWWFDANGRFEDADVYCGIGRLRDSQWELGCQWKSPPGRYSFVVLRETEERMEPVSPWSGHDIGLVFSSLVDCIRWQVNASNR